MENWLKAYGKFLNFQILELELGLPSRGGASSSKKFKYNLYRDFHFT